MKNLYIVPFNDAEAAGIIRVLGRCGATWIRLGHESPKKSAYAKKFAQESTVDHAIAADGLYFVFSEQKWGANWLSLEESIKDLLQHFDEVFAVEMLGTEKVRTCD